MDGTSKRRRQDSPTAGLDGKAGWDDFIYLQASGGVKDVVRKGGALELGNRSGYTTDLASWRMALQSLGL